MGSVPTRLDELRLKINSLPEEQRPFFRDAVEKAQEQHDRMQEQCAKIRDMTADIGLIVEHCKFDLAARRRELRQIDPHGHFQL